LVLGGRRPLDVDLFLKGAGHRILEDLRRRLVKMLADMDLRDLRMRTFARLAAGTGRCVPMNADRGAEQLDPLIEPLGGDLSVDTFELHIDRHLTAPLRKGTRASSGLI